MSRTRDMVRLYADAAGVVHVRGVFALPAEHLQTACGLDVPCYHYQHLGNADLITCLACSATMVARRAYWNGEFEARYGESPTAYGEHRLATFYGRRRLR